MSHFQQAEAEDLSSDADGDEDDAGRDEDNDEVLPHAADEEEVPADIPQHDDPDTPHEDDVEDGDHIEIISDDEDDFDEHDQSQDDDDVYDLLFQSDEEVHEHDYGEEEYGHVDVEDITQDDVEDDSEEPRQHSDEENLPPLDAEELSENSNISEESSCVTPHITVEVLLSLCGYIRSLLAKKAVRAVKEDRNSYDSSTITIRENHIYVHSLRPQPPSGHISLKVSFFLFWFVLPLFTVVLLPLKQ